MITKWEYKQLKARQEMASRNNDYSKMILMGSEEDALMTEYEQNNICEHPNIVTIGGVDICQLCGKQF